jgi:hypothetical protein
MEARSLPLSRVEAFKIGYVRDPIPGHEQYRGMLAIPYIRQNALKTWSVVTMRFRRIGDSGGTKYRTMPGDPPRLFNTVDAVRNEDEIAITEGEMDAIAASINGIPAVGVPGAEIWKSHFTDVFLGYERVWILADGDDAGLRFANTVAGLLGNAVIVPMDSGHDVNSMVSNHGIESVLERMGKSDA